MIVVAALSVALTGAVPADANAPAPRPVDVGRLATFYRPTPDLADLNNWRTYNAYNVVHYVSKNLPNRQPNDQTSTDPVGPGNLAACLALSNESQGCANHQLEYLSWFETAFGDVLKDFGVTFRTYQFNSGGSGPGTLASNAGRALNKLAIVPGADDPEDIVLIGSHYDQVDGSPFAAWDQTSGTGVMLRTAKILSDYWKSTGTRPSKTYVFAAWDAEEAGALGSKFYVGTRSNRSSENGTLPKDPNVTLTAYLNHDPCGAAYPALYRGVPASRQPLSEKTGFIPVNVALHAPGGNTTERARMTAFNASIRPLINDLFNQIDDTLPVAPGHAAAEVLPVFVSKEEAAALGHEALEQESVLKVNEAGSLLGFTTDAESFHDWVPTLNPFPDVLGPHGVSTNPESTGWSADALVWVHTPLDSFEGLVAYTSPDQTGLTYSKGLAMSWELCSMLSAAVMLQPAQGGATPANTDPVAFFETPTPNRNGGTHVFNASGSYRYENATTRKLDPSLVYEWDFGDGTTAEGRTVSHTYGTYGGGAAGRAYEVTLTVTDPQTQKSDRMMMKIGTGRL